MQIVQAVKKLNSISRERLNFRRQAILCTTFLFIYLFINVWGIPQQGIGLPWSRGSPNNVDDMHEQVMPVLVNAGARSECKREVWCWECEREGSMEVAVKRIDTETVKR